MNQPLDLPLEVEAAPDADLLMPADDLSRRHTAERVSQVSARRDAILRALGCGIPVAAICEVFACGPATVSALASLHPDLVEVGKKRLAGKFQFAAHLALDSAMQDIQAGRMPAASKSIAAGIFSDKSMQLAGEPVVVIEHRHTADPAALARRARAWIESPSSVLPAIGVGSGSDDAGGVSPPGLDPGLSGRAGDEVADHPGGGVGFLPGASGGDAFTDFGHSPKDHHE